MTSAYPDERAALLDAAVARLASTRRTFTEEEALAPLWEAGFEVTPYDDSRLRLAWEASATAPRHWCLAHHVVANDRLHDRLVTGKWDGRNLDAELKRLSARDGVHYVLYPHDPRLAHHAGIWELATHERNVRLDPATRSALEALLPGLLDRLAEAPGTPWTVGQITEALGSLGWGDVGRQEAWLKVRAWLLSQPAFARVGADYWLPTPSVPTPARPFRVAVLPVQGAGPAVPSRSPEADADAPPEGEFRPSSPGAAREAHANHALR